MARYLLEVRISITPIPMSYGHETDMEALPALVILCQSFILHPPPRNACVTRADVLHRVTLRSETDNSGRTSAVFRRPGRHLKT